MGCISFSRGSSQGPNPGLLAMAGGFFTTELSGNPKMSLGRGNRPLLPNPNSRTRHGRVRTGMVRVLWFTRQTP